MMSLFRKLFLLILLVGSFTVSSQAQEKEKKGIIYARANTLGILLHSNGLGVSTDFIRTGSIFNRPFYRFELNHVKHPKEIRSPARNSPIRRNNRPFVYGKENSFYDLSASRGVKKMLADKGRKSGVELSWLYTYGVSIGILKPYYLMICYDDSGVCDPREESYSAETMDVFLDANVIVGRAPFSKGLFESKIIPGFKGSLGINIDYAVFDQFIQSIEAGIMINAYYKRVQLMLTDTNQFIHPNLYVKMSIGKRHYR